jgi:hypothetical protein
MISNQQFGSKPSLTANKQAMPESVRYNGPAGLEISGAQNKFAANSGKYLPKPGFGS